MDDERCVMRNNTKTEILQALQSLQEMVQEIRITLQNEDYETLSQYLQDCQDMAITIGGVIEESEGEGTSAVKALEEYCESLYQLFKGQDSFEMMNGSLEVARREIGAIKEHKEVVFLPYKASMWDSLESVWKAADEDDGCDAYVVPIPYFDKNSDGRFGEMHYEGEEYPDYVPVTKWQEYDLERRRPDIIYIHNPYDGWNHVTSVHPDFYASKLKNYTGKLVYIPYFVLGEIDPNNQKAIDGMKHFCFLPGTIYTDKVILQSENMKQIYVEEFLKEAVKSGLTGECVDRGKLEEKFLGIGSPKFDKVANSRREDVKIPEEWKKYIRKTDGSEKKIILYNNTINALLNKDEKMLDKMERVLEIFKEQSENITLWWRPHPLLPSTIKSMKPNLWNRYNEIVEKYKSEDWGIYDDTPDLDRAIVCTDAYYGDQSSLVPIYQKTGKPIMIANCEV